MNQRCPRLGTHTPLQSCPLFALQWKRGTKQPIQDRWRTQVSRQGDDRRHGVPTGFKTCGRRRTRGTRQGGCRPIDLPFCANTGAVVNKNVRNARAQRNHLYLRAISTYLSAQKPQEHPMVGVYRAKNRLRQASNTILTATVCENYEQHCYEQNRAKGESMHQIQSRRRKAPL